MRKEALESDALEIAYILESAACGEITWEGVLKQIAEIIPGTSLHSIHHDPFASKALTLSGYSVDGVIADSFRRYYIGINPWAPVIAALPSGSVFVSERQCRHIPLKIPNTTVIIIPGFTLGANATGVLTFLKR